FALVLPLVHNDWRLWVLAVGQGVWIAGSVIYNVNQVSFRQALAPDRLLGRMNATMRFLVWGTLPLGGLLGGGLGQTIRVRNALWVGTIGGTLSFLFVFFSPLRTARELPSHQDEEEIAVATAGAASDETEITGTAVPAPVVVPGGAEHGLAPGGGVSAAP